MTSAKAWGIDAELLTTAQIKELVPFINDDVILGGFHSPTVSVVDSLRAGTLMREEAVDAGHLQVFANVEVLDIEVVDGTVRAVVTDQGRIEADQVVIACGVWSPRIAAMAGATIPSRPPCTRWPMSARSTCSSSPAWNSRTRSSATWTRSCTNANPPDRWKWAPTPTVRSSIAPTTYRRTTKPRSPPPSFRSPTKTSTTNSKMRSNSWVTSSRRPRFATRSTGCSRSPPTPCPCWAKPSRSAISGPRRRYGSRRGRASPSSSPSG